ncbi:RHOMBOID-like protein 3 isoform X4 [Gastrolobium bilobum]|uniref:RHOMBOID-like protein 3 isoform X4 n=1 Tax=Gastrolobium bilobum TaxID=150636 RepID=UPI002AB1F0A9|nr:RHOMBOID-like protein 3 isoform X4 [Gastrolobium bilobum]
MSRRDLESGVASKNNIAGNNNNNNNYSAAPNSYVYDPEIYWTSWLVPLIVVANVVVFIVAMFVNNCPRKNPGFEGDCVARFLGRFSFQPLRENPLFGPSSLTLTKMGALQWDDVVNHHQGWRLVTCIWLHAGIVHLAANMLSLVFIGIRLEQQFGFVRIGIIYLLSGFGGSVLSSLFIRNNISVGASGALFGLLGAMLSELITNWTIYTNKFGWLEQRHLPAGARLKSKYMTYQYVMWIVSVILLIVGLSIALVMLFRGENGYDHCHWCHYLTCLPTSKWKCDDS